MTASPRLPVGARIALSVPPNPCKVKKKKKKTRRENTYTPKLFSAQKTQVPQQAKKRFGVYQKLVFKRKRRKIHIHQTGFKVFVGDPFVQHRCIDFGLLKTLHLPVVGNVTAALVRFFAACQGWAGLQCPVRGQRTHNSARRHLCKFLGALCHSLSGTKTLRFIKRWRLRLVAFAF